MIKTTKIDIANIALMLLSLAAAFLLPFELFLFSYAVLGPLHYLTEISWLHKKHYFTNHKYDYVPLIPLGIALAVVVLFYQDLNKYANLFIFVSFVWALSSVLFRSWSAKIIITALACLLSLLFINNSSFQTVFGIFLPTIIHVFVFTGLFILTGALKNKSLSSILSLVVFISCIVVIFSCKNFVSPLTTSAYATNTFLETSIAGINVAMLQLLNIGNIDVNTILFSNIGLAVMRFIAFIYTYHYLNWFSKTSVIQWHNVPIKWLVTVAILWVASVGLYAYNYMVGLQWLYLLSMLHVLLEFPLNFRSLQDIFNNTKQILFSAKTQ